MKERKVKELQRFQQVMVENEENQRRLREEAEREREEVNPQLSRTSKRRKNTLDFKTNLNADASKRRGNVRRRSKP